MANRRGYGINTLWISLLCIFTEASCNREAKTFDGIVPFLVPGDLATPNPAYFQRVDDVLRIGADHGMVVLLDPIETISWLDILRKNGTSKHLSTDSIWEIATRTFPTSSGCMATTYSHGEMLATTIWCRPSRVDQKYRCKPHPYSGAQL